MNLLLCLFACYGICFAIQNKLPFLHSKHEKVDKFLVCPYCVGFHSGWIVYLLQMDTFVIMDIILWAFASSALCYMLDISAQYIESKT